MVLYNNLYFFNKHGNELNLELIPRIAIQINGYYGNGASLRPITDTNNKLIYIEILSPGFGYDDPNTSIRISDINNPGQYVEIPYTDIIFDSNGGFSSFVIQPHTSVLPFPTFYYNGSVFFEKLSAGLIGNEHIFMLEKVISNNQLTYQFPKTNIENAFFQFEWEDETGDNEIQLYETDDINNTPYINYFNSIGINLNENASDVIVTDKRYLRQTVDDAEFSLQVNIAASSNYPGTYSRFLRIYYVIGTLKYLIGLIHYQAEVFEEDSRLNIMLNNFGKSFEQKWEYILRESDINEQKTDFNLLNYKRKELLLEGDNIYPYIGSYKAIVNVLNWLGYGEDLSIKEYWLNIDETSQNYKKYRQTEIPFKLKGKGADYQSNDILPSDVYKKTNLFGLFYKINEEDGTYDEFGTPNTVDTFKFTQEEILIKLYGLKKFLKEKFLPFNARIIDIVGEGIYFTTYNVNTFTDSVHIHKIAATREIDFVAKETTIYTQDLRELLDYNYFVSSSINELSPSYNPDDLLFLSESLNLYNMYRFKDISLNDIYSVRLGYFDNINDTTNFPSEPNNYLIGAPLHLQIIDPSSRLDEMDMTWDSFASEFRPATINFNIDGTGTVMGYDIIDGGYGYDYDNTDLYIQNIGPDPAVHAEIISFTVTNSSITALFFTGGSGYTSAPSCYIYGNPERQSMYTWDNISFGDFYEAEWVVKSDDNFFYEYRKRGVLSEMINHTVYLPKKGQYSVELIMYDTDNNWTNEIKRKYITVDLNEIRCGVITRHHAGIETWDDAAHLQNDDMTGLWVTPDNNPTNIDSMANTCWDDYSLSTYHDHITDWKINDKLYNLIDISEYTKEIGNIRRVDVLNKKIYVTDEIVNPNLQTYQNSYLSDGTTHYPVIISQTSRKIQNYKITQYGSGYLFSQITPSILIPENPGTNAKIDFIFSGKLNLSHLTVFPIPNFVGTPPAPTWDIPLIFPAPFNGTAAQGYLKIGEITPGNYNVQNIVITDFGSGYNFLPEAKLDESIPAIIGSSWVNLGNVVKATDLEGFIKDCVIDNPGEGFTSLTYNLSIPLPILGGTPTLIDAYAGIGGSYETVYTLENMPMHTNIDWLFCYKVGPSVLLEGNCIYNEINGLDGLKQGDYLYFNNNLEAPLISEIPVIDILKNGIGHEYGITINNIYNLKKGEKCRFYKKRVLAYNSGTFETDSANNLLYYYPAVGSNIDEIIPGFSVITYKKRDASNNATYTNRCRVIGVSDFGAGYVLNIEDLDGHLNLFESIGPLNLTYSTDVLHPSIQILNVDTVEWDYYEFYSEIININGNDITFDFNYYPLSEQIISDYESSVNSWYIDYSINTGEYSIKVSWLTLEGMNTRVYLDDQNSELIQVGTLFNAYRSTYDTDYANRMWGFNNETWDNYDELTIDELNQFRWYMFFHADSTNCGYRITKVLPGGRVKLDEFPVFEFSSVSGVLDPMYADLDHQMMSQAITDLNSSDNEGISSFYYSLVTTYDNLTPLYYIQASAKTPAGMNIMYIQFDNGVQGEYQNDRSLSHSYPLKNTNNIHWTSGYYGPANVESQDPILHPYNEYGADSAGNPGWYPGSLPALYESTDNREISLKIPYLFHQSGSFSWDDVRASYYQSEYPKGVKAIITTSQTDIPSKCKYDISLLKDGEVMVRTKKPYIIWQFNRAGVYDLLVSITDINENVKTELKKSIITIYETIQ